MVTVVCYVSSSIACTDFKGAMFKSDLTDNFYLQCHIVMRLVLLCLAITHTSHMKLHGLWSPPNVTDD